MAIIGYFLTRFGYFWTRIGCFWQELGIFAKNLVFFGMKWVFFHFFRNRVFFYKKWVFFTKNFFLVSSFRTQNFKKKTNLSSFHVMPIGFCVKNYAIKMYCNKQFQKNNLRFQVSEAETSEETKKCNFLELKKSLSDALFKNNI